MSETTNLPQPLGLRVLVLPDEAASKTKGGLMLPENAQQKPSTGTVVALGSGAIVGSKHEDVPPSLLQKKVLFNKWDGREVEHEGTAYLIMDAGLLLCTMPDVSTPLDVTETEQTKN